MKISVFARTSEKKSDPKQNRRQGEVPGVIYGLDQANHNIFVKKDELEMVLRKLPKGLLPTTVFEVQDGNQKFSALVKEIQYHPTSYAVLHIDFLRLADEIPVTINVPIKIVGEGDCVGIKLGGFLRQAIRTLKVSCLPKDIPQEFSLDIREMNIADSKTLRDIPIPDRVRPLVGLREVAVVIAKKV